MMESDNQIHINKLPREVLHNIFSLLGYRDLISVGRTCKDLHSLSKDDVLLQRIARREFNEDLWNVVDDTDDIYDDDYDGDDGDLSNSTYPSKEQIILATILGTMLLKLIHKILNCTSYNIFIF